MTNNTLVVIGTAGRRDDYNRLSAQHYERMVNATVTLIDVLGLDPETLHLVSGGAAWADHIAVDLVLRQIIKPRQLQIHLPCDLQYNRFDGHDAASSKAASTLQYHHDRFSHKTGKHSIAELYEVYKSGSEIRIDASDFKGRNTHVAMTVCGSGYLLAHTFGHPASEQPPWTIREFASASDAHSAGIKPGGTADTWTKARPYKKFHCRLY